MMLCERCDCKAECEYYKYTMKPILHIVKKTAIVRDSFLDTVANAIRNFECEYFEKKM